MGVAAREDHEVAGAQRRAGAVRQDQLAPAVGDEVDAAQPGQVEADAERRAELEPAVRGALEPQLAQDGAEQVAIRGSGRAHVHPSIVAGG